MSQLLQYIYDNTNEDRNSDKQIHYVRKSSMWTTVAGFRVFTFVRLSARCLKNRRS